MAQRTLSPAIKACREPAPNQFYHTWSTTFLMQQRSPFKFKLFCDSAGQGITSPPIPNKYLVAVLLHGTRAASILDSLISKPLHILWRPLVGSGETLYFGVVGWGGHGSGVQSSEVVRFSVGTCGVWSLFHTQKKVQWSSCGTFSLVPDAHAEPAGGCAGPIVFIGARLHLRRSPIPTDPVGLPRTIYWSASSSGFDRVGGPETTKWYTFKSPRCEVWDGRRGSRSLSVRKMPSSLSALVGQCEGLCDIHIKR